MNIWSKKTLDLVKTQDYLDKLQTIYPQEDIDRDLDEESLFAISKAFDIKDDNKLLELALNFDKFPYKDSYVGFLRKDRTSIERNPDTVDRICKNLYDMGINGIIDGLKTSKEANRRRGNQFSDWLKNNFNFVDKENFLSSKEGIVILDASESEAKYFCNNEMGVALQKRPDIVAKANTKYVIGEAKFLSQSGGNQDRGFDDGMALVKNPAGNAYKIFILDGIYWICDGSERFSQIVYGNSAVFSALFLHDYLTSVAQGLE